MSNSGDCYFFNFGLIVTGEGEREHLHKLFRSLLSTQICRFTVLRRIGQRSPIRSEKRKAKMVGVGKSIPDKDAGEIGLPARRYLQEGVCNFIILIDDLEDNRRSLIQEIFDRYRSALDTMLNQEQRRRASVHFLVNMLEAYFFADAAAINTALSLNLLLEDAQQDVETIRHPKKDLKHLNPGYDEIRDGGIILNILDVEHILSRPDACGSLRSCFAWCVNVLEQHPVKDYLGDLNLHQKYRLVDGVFNEVTRAQ